MTEKLSLGKPISDHQPLDSLSKTRKIDYRSSSQSKQGNARKYIFSSLLAMGLIIAGFGIYRWWDGAEDQQNYFVSNQQVVSPELPSDQSDPTIDNPEELNPKSGNTPEKSSATAKNEANPGNRQSPPPAKARPKLEVKALANIIVNNQVGDYTGETLRSKPHGKGKMIWGNGDTYEGFFEDGIISGAGTFIWANGDKYLGSFRSGNPEGQGVLTLKNGVIPNCPGCVKYNGSWKAGKKEGFGTCLDKAGNAIFQGIFLGDRPPSK